MANNPDIIIHTMKEDLLLLKQKGVKKSSFKSNTPSPVASKDEVLRLIQEAQREREKVEKERKKSSQIEKLITSDIVTQPKSNITENQGVSSAQQNPQTSPQQGLANNNLLAAEAKRKAEEAAEAKRKAEEKRRKAFLTAQKRATEITAQEEAQRKAEEIALHKVWLKQLNVAIKKAKAILAQEEKVRAELLAQEKRRKITRWKATLAQIQIRARDIVLREKSRREREEELQERKWQKILEATQERSKEIIIYEEEAINEKLQKAENLLETQIRSLATKIGHIPIDERPILTQKQKLEDIKKQLDQENENIRKRLEATRKERMEIENKEEAAQDSKTRRKFEKKRWQIATKQRNLEKELWGKEEEISKTILAINKIKQQLEDFEDQKRKLEEKKNDIASEKKIIELRQEKLNIKKRLAEIKGLKADPSLRLQRLKIGKTELEKKLSQIIQKEQSMEAKERNLTQIPEEKKELIEARWKIEKERETIEKERWETEEAIKSTGKAITKTEPIYLGLTEEEKHLQDRDYEIDVLLKFGPEEGKRRLDAEKKEAQNKKKTAVADRVLAEPSAEKTNILAEKISPEKPIKKIIPPIPPKTKEEIAREKLIQEVKENIEIIKKESLKIVDQEEREKYVQKMKKMIQGTYPELNPKSIEVYFQEVK